MTNRTEIQTIASLFDQWTDLHAQFSALSDAEHTPETDMRFYDGISDAVYATLALAPVDAMDVWRKVVMSLDAPDAGDTTSYEARLVREARLALGLPPNHPQ